MFDSAGCYEQATRSTRVADVITGNGVWIINNLGENEVVSDIDFGNRPIDQGTGEIHGTKWNDLDGNGSRDSGEAGLAGVTIFLDQNNNGVLDTDEPSTVTSGDDVETPQDETGSYQFTDLSAGTFTVAEVVPTGYEQTFPSVSTSQLELPQDGFAIVGSSDARIVGGQDADEGEYPWMVSVQDSFGDDFCGGALIDSESGTSEAR